MILLKASQENLCHIYDFGVEESCYWIVMKCDIFTCTAYLWRLRFSSEVVIQVLLYNSQEMAIVTGVRSPGAAQHSKKSTVVEPCSTWFLRTMKEHLFIGRASQYSTRMTSSTTIWSATMWWLRWTRSGWDWMLLASRCFDVFWQVKHSTISLVESSKSFSNLFHSSDLTC